MNVIQKQFGFDAIFGEDEMSDILHDAVLQFFFHSIKPYGNKGEGKLYVGMLDIGATVIYRNLCMGLREYGHSPQEAIIQADGSLVLLTPRQARK